MEKPSDETGIQVNRPAAVPPNPPEAKARFPISNMGTRARKAGCVGAVVGAFAAGLAGMCAAEEGHGPSEIAVVTAAFGAAVGFVAAFGVTALAVHLYRAARFFIDSQRIGLGAADSIGNEDD
jgi:hypothetical protein